MGTRRDKKGNKKGNKKDGNGGKEEKGRREKEER